jgi:TetR/AcrR family transcriptional regulator, cholesterol catabolism regulator
MMSDLRRARRRQIAEGALRLFKVKGFHQTSVREIAAAAGLSMGGLYEHIDSKDDVLNLVYEHLIEGLRESAPDRDAPLRELLTSLLRAAAAHADEVQLMYRETASLDPEHRERIAVAEREQAVVIRAAIERDGVGGVDAELTAHVVVFLTAFYPLRRWVLRHRPDLDESVVADAIADLVVRGLRGSRRRR